MLEQLNEILRTLKRARLLTWFTLAIGVGLSVMAGKYLSSWSAIVLKDWAILHQTPTDDNKKQFDASLEIVKALVGSIGTLATIVGGIILYLNFRIANKNTELTESRLITERFSKAVEQLGNDKIEVRLGGIYSLERIAKDSERDHWTIMEVLTTFVREKSFIAAAAKSKTKQSLVEHYQQQSQPKILDLPVTKDLEAALTVCGRRECKKDRGKFLDLHFSNLNFTRLSNAHLKGANLTASSLTGTDLTRANLSGANLTDARTPFTNFSGANLSRANLTRSWLYRTNFSGANLTQVDLTYTSMNNIDSSGTHINFSNGTHINFSGANLTDANLTNANLTNANLTDANLTDANLRGAYGLTENQLKKATIYQTTMPDGTISDRDRNKVGSKQDLKSMKALFSKCYSYFCGKPTAFMARFTSKE